VKQQKIKNKKKSFK